MVRICVASLHQKDQRRKYAGFLFYPVSQVSLSRVDSNSCGDVAEDGAKTAQCNSDDRCQRQKQGGAVGAAASRMRVPPKARRSRWEPRPGFLFILRGSRHPPAPTKKSSIRTGYWIFCFADTFSGLGGMTAASGRSREALLGLRPAGCACRPRHDAAAGSRDPGSFLFCAAHGVHPAKRSFTAFSRKMRKQKPPSGWMVVR